MINGSRERREPQANGVTGVAFPSETSVFCGSNLIRNLRFEIIQPPHTGHSACAAFPAAINHLAVYSPAKALDVFLFDVAVGGSGCDFVAKFFNCFKTSALHALSCQSRQLVCVNMGLLIRHLRFSLLLKLGWKFQRRQPLAMS